LASRKGAAEEWFKGEFRRARAFRRSEAEAIRFVQRNFAQGLEYPIKRKFAKFLLMEYYRCGANSF
jgi:hypothetical protein